VLSRPCIKDSSRTRPKGPRRVQQYEVLISRQEVSSARRGFLAQARVTLEIGAEDGSGCCDVLVAGARSPYRGFAEHSTTPARNNAAYFRRRSKCLRRIRRTTSQTATSTGGMVSAVATVGFTRQPAAWSPSKVRCARLAT
jgi:hypothetical protein